MTDGRSYVDCVTMCHLLSKEFTRYSPVSAYYWKTRDRKSANQENVRIRLALREMCGRAYVAEGLAKTGIWRLRSPNWPGVVLIRRRSLSGMSGTRLVRMNFEFEFSAKKNEGFQLAATETLLKLAVRLSVKPMLGDPQPFVISADCGQNSKKRKNE